MNLSDPSILTEMYGWSVIRLVDNYIRLAELCFAAMGAVYIWGLFFTYGDFLVQSGHATDAAPKPAAIASSVKAS